MLVLRAWTSEERTHPKEHLTRKTNNSRSYTVVYNIYVCELLVSVSHLNCLIVVLKNSKQIFLSRHSSVLGGEGKRVVN